MVFILDSEVAAVFEAMAANGIRLPVSVRGDWRALRLNLTAMTTQMLAVPSATDVRIQSFRVKVKDGAEIELRWYTNANKAAGGSAVVYAGMILGSAQLFDPVVADYVSATGVPFLSVDYRLAPEFTAPTPVAVKAVLTFGVN